MFKRLSRILKISVFCTSVLVILISLIYDLLLTKINSPLELRENAIIITTSLLVKNINPYSLAQMPIYTNVYGIFYNLLVYPFAKIFGVNFFIHRIISAIFIFLSSFVVYKVLLKNRVEKTLALTGFTILYSQIISQGYDVLSRPDSLGLFLFLLSIFVPRWRKYSYSSLFLGMFLGSLAFLTKPYFILGIPILIFYLFLFVSKSKAIIFSAISFAYLAILFIIINKYFETYFINTVFINFEIAGNDYGHLIKQIKEYFIWNIGFVIPLLLMAVSTLKNHLKRLLPVKLNIPSIQKPLFNKKVDIVTFTIIISSLVIYFKLGRHTGNYMTYFFHLISPFLIVFVLTAISKFKSLSKILIYLSLLGTLFFWEYQVTFKISSTNENANYWQEWEKTLSGYNNVYNSPLIAHILFQENKPIYDTGQSEYFTDGLILNQMFNLVKRADLRQTDFENSVRDQVKLKKFDLVTVTKSDYKYFSRELLGSNYSLVNIVTVTLFNDNWPIEIWKPKLTKN
jgi:hypothetical protein